MCAKPIDLIFNPLDSFPGIGDARTVECPCNPQLLREFLSQLIPRHQTMLLVPELMDS